MAEVDMESNSSGSDSSSEMEEDINEEEIKEEIKLYKHKILENKTDYDAHLNLTKSYRKLGELDELRDARKHFSQIYPLTPEIWMQWLSDEQKICTSDEERSDIVELFEKAAKDYINVSIWVEYILFMLKGGNHEATREVCEKALTAVGIHFADGILAWQAVMLVEQQLFSNLQEEGNEHLITEQKKRIQNLFRRQAGVPLLNMNGEEFLADAQDWFGGQIDKAMENDLKKSLKLSSELVPFEAALGVANDDVEKLEAYRKYLDFVRKNSNPAFIQNTYERAVVELCLHAGIWEEFVKFVMEQFPHAGYVVLPICQRSQRNCPWSSALCYLHIKALQKYTEDSKELPVLVKGCLEKSLASGVQDKEELNRIWMSYLVFLRMQINWDGEHEKSLQFFRETCHQAADYIWGVTEDVDCEIPRYHAKVEATFVKNMENIRSIYNENILRRGNNFNRTDIWLEFIKLERSCGDTKHARKLFRRALERVWGDVELIAGEFCKFEQEVGTLETIEDFERKYTDRLAVVQKRRLEEAAKLTSEKPTTKSENRKGKKENPKKKHEETVETDFRKKMKLSTSHKQEYSSLKRPTEEAESRPHKKQKVESSTHGETVKHDPSNDYRSVFLSNLDYTSGEEEILPTFAKCGEVESFRLVRDFNGRSKGFGYLVFKEATAVKEALKLDRTPVGRRPMFVSECNVAKDSHTFKYPTGLEKDKLFVRGLPISMKEDDVRKVFSALCKIKDMRLVTHRNGFSRGCCYVQYFNVNDAEKVRIAMDGTELEGRNITVLISNPSNKEPSQAALRNKYFNPADSSKPGTSQVRGQRERLSFVPRSLSTAKPTKPKNSDEAVNGSEMSAPKSNDDFRKLLTK